MRYAWIEEFEGPRREELYEFYKKEWWTKGRTFSDVAQMLDHSDLTLGCCGENGKLVGFSRVLTDFTFKALIFDVIVHSDFRGYGIGKALIDRIIGHDALSKVNSFELYCPERLIPFYQKLGFNEGTSKLLRFKR
ncbi:GNAT family N-acetyltransferase [Hoeflea sp. WL0058]|uniref:GNAT family N-acetyltransferase n=1 Tax=Flavimaribacter sediminis TaxID=2865987 RepID=A0AAE2ZND4_9HYPH|nr:GNAT family N-acetyltransferase [Flavimaribacter sediminis]MBW8639119.1 GNAT family N-acetyltransferase [Flavimaribacter sediminis]